MAPTVLVVHGSWHTPKHYKRQLDALEQAGFPTSCPLQPSVGKLPPMGLRDDARAIREELTKLVEVECRDVIVVAHSYGGVVASEAVDARFGRTVRAAKGQSGGVVELLFVCAFVLPVGESLASAFGDPERLPSFTEVRDDRMCMMKEPARRFYNDLPEAEQKQCVDDLVWCPATAQLERINQAAYTLHPVTYLFCANDRAIPVQLQQSMVDSSEELGVRWKRETCSTSHSPFLSAPQVIVDVVKKIATESKQG